MVGDQGGVGGSRRAAAHRVVNDAHAAEARFLPAQPDGGGAVGHGLDAAWGQRRGAWEGGGCSYNNTENCSFNPVRYHLPSALFCTCAKRDRTFVLSLVRSSLPHGSRSIDLLVECPNSHFILSVRD